MKAFLSSLSVGYYGESCDILCTRWESCALSQVKIQGLGKTPLCSGYFLLFWFHSPKCLKTGLLTASLGLLAILSRSGYHTLRKYPLQFCPCLRPISTRFSNLSYSIEDKDPSFLVLWKTIVPPWEFQLFSVGSFSSSGRFLMKGKCNGSG